MYFPCYSTQQLENFNLQNCFILVNESWNEDLEPDLHLEENISNLDISGIFDFTPTNSIRKKRKVSNTYCTINELKALPSSASDSTEHTSFDTDKELEDFKEIPKFSVNTKISNVTEKSSSKEVTKNSDNSIETSPGAIKDTKYLYKNNEHEKDNERNAKNSSKSDLSRMNDSNKCETSSTKRPSQPAKTKSNKNETDQISLSSHVVNNVNSNAIINTSSQTEAVHTQIQHYADAPYRLLRSYSTSTCSALYSPLLKGRKGNDLRFQQQKGRYSDTICSRYPKNISGYEILFQLLIQL